MKYSWILIVAFLVGLAVAFVTGCAKSKMSYKNRTVTQNCTVENIGEAAHITCPDGTELTVNPETVVVTIEVPTECDDGSADMKHDHDSGDQTSSDVE